MVKNQPAGDGDKENVPSKSSLNSANAGNAEKVVATKAQIGNSLLESLAKIPEIFEIIAEMLSFADLKTLLRVSKSVSHQVMNNTKISKRIVLRSDRQNNFAVLFSQRPYLHHKMIECCLNAHVIGENVKTLELHNVVINDSLDESMQHFSNLCELKLVNIKIEEGYKNTDVTWTFKSLTSLEITNNFLLILKKFSSVNQLKKLSLSMTRDSKMKLVVIDLIGGFKEFMAQQTDLEEFILNFGYFDKNHNVFPQNVSWPLKKLAISNHECSVTDFSDILMSCKSTLKDLSLYGSFSYASIITVFNELHNLKSLEMENFYAAYLYNRDPMTSAMRDTHEHIYNRHPMRNLNFLTNQSIESLNCNLVFTYHFFPDTNAFFKKLPNLKKLCLVKSWYNHDELTTSMMTDIMQLLPKLEELHFPPFWIEYVPYEVHFPNIKCISFHCNLGVSYNHIPKVFPNVESIELIEFNNGWADFLDDYDLIQIALISSLKYLKLGKIKQRKLKTSTILSFLDICSSLVYLEIPEGILSMKVSKKDAKKLEAVKKESSKLRFI